MAEMDIPFRVQTKRVEEVFPKGLSPKEAAIHLCRLKSNAFAAEDLNDNTLLITADTVVALNNRILGKPAGKREAEVMLQQLSGKKHEVITGVCLRLPHRSVVFTASTTVWFKPLAEEEIRYYVSHYQPFDKAGAYGIQEWIGHAAIEKIAGSYFNVMGLPTRKLYQELDKLLEK